MLSPKAKKYWLPKLIVGTLRPIPQVSPQRGFHPTTDDSFAFLEQCSPTVVKIEILYNE